MSSAARVSHSDGTGKMGTMASRGVLSCLGSRTRLVLCVSVCQGRGEVVCGSLPARRASLPFSPSDDDAPDHIASRCIRQTSTRADGKREQGRRGRAACASSNRHLRWRARATRARTPTSPKHAPAVVQCTPGMSMAAFAAGLPPSLPLFPPRPACQRKSARTAMGRVGCGGGVGALRRARHVWEQRRRSGRTLRCCALGERSRPVASL